MRMKRAWVIGFLALTAALCGCGKRQEEPENTLLYEDEIEDSDDYIVVGFAQVGSESDWRLANTQSFRDTFREDKGYYLLFEDGQQKQENQIKAIRNFILQEVDYIILDPIVETGWDAVLQEAKAAGIPVILSDRLVEVEDESLYTCWVGSDFEEEGQIAGRWLKAYLAEHGREEEEIRIVTLQGTLDSSAQIGRTVGFDKILRQQENWIMLDRGSGDFTLTKGREVMESFLDLYDDIDVVVCENDNMAFGAIQAIREAGKTCGPGGDMIMISIDGTRAALEAMADGELHMVMECNPLLGPMVEEIIKKLERGEEVDRVQYVEEQYFDASMDLERIMESRTY